MADHRAEYAVVRFVDEDSVSEVPTNWLFRKEEQQLCWWPKNSKRLSSLIANRTTPEPKTWGHFSVQIEAYCSTLDKARKRAVDTNYITTDDEHLGRGLRQLLTNPITCDSSDDDSTSGHLKKMSKRGDKFHLTQPPSLPGNMNILNTPIFLLEDELLPDNMSSIIDHDFQNTNITEDCSQERNIASSTTSQQLDINWNPSNNKKKKPTITEIRVVKPTANYDTKYELHSTNQELHQQVDTNSNLTNTPKNKPKMTKTKVPEQTSNYSMKANHVINQVTLVETDINLKTSNTTQVRDATTSQTREPESNKPKLSIEEELVNVHRLLAAINVNLTSINQRLTQLAKGSVEQHVLEVLCDYNLPLVGPASIEALENILQKNKNEEVAQFKKLVLRVGGDSPKDNIQRVLKKVFTNYCAAHSTWMGKGENNFGVNNLLVIQIIRDVLCSSHTTLKERDFDKIVAEWFRFGKQRWLRELQAKSKTIAENECTNTEKVQI